jgi:hypothetical protein
MICTCARCKLRLGLAHTVSATPARTVYDAEAGTRIPIYCCQ